MIKCAICEAEVHSIELHLRNDTHPGVTLESYKRSYPGQPLFSEQALAKMKEQGMTVAQDGMVVKAAVATKKTLAQAATAPAATGLVGVRKAPFHTTFGLKESSETKNARGGDIPITVYDVPQDLEMYRRSIDPDHIWLPEDLKNMLLALELRMPLLVYGHKGTGKTTDLMQIAARTGRPMIRVQHTGNTEESHITGQYVVRGGNLEWQEGLLAFAMRRGLMYIADEYDFAQPAVLAVYQPIMEGEPLVIKEAPPEHRVVEPAMGFTFCATGNTNGTGDSAGLYQGTVMQNAANYDRFGMAIKKDYLPEAQEVQAIMKHAEIAQPEAVKLVKFASEIRKQFDAGKLGDTISTRALINSALIGVRRTKLSTGVRLCFSNKLNEQDRTVIDGVAQRCFG